MKYLKIFIIGFLVMVTIQFGVLLFLEKVYFAYNVSYSSKKVENIESKEIPKPKLILENGSSNTSASYDGKYLAYLKNKKLLVLNLEDSNKNEVSANDDMEILYYKWIYDRNRIILAAKPINFKGGETFKLYYYDADSKSKVEIFNEVNSKSIKMPIYSSTEKIDDIDMSTLTNVIYVKSSNSNNYSRIYRINIMAQQNRINTATSNVGKIISTKRDDVLLYESLNDGRVFIYGNSTPVKIDGNSNLNLLGIDTDDNVYLALTNDDKAQIIYYGNVVSKDWKSIDMKEAIDISNIYVNYKGQIFINDSSKAKIKEISTGKEIHYNGKIIGIYEDGIINKKDDEIIKTIF